MNKIEELRYSLYKAIERGNEKEILTLSRKLDKQIVEFIKRTDNKRVGIIKSVFLH